MDSNQLLRNEQIITQSGDKVVTLTNLRLRYMVSSWGKSHVTSMLLERISSIEIHYKSSSLLALLGISSIIAGFAGSIEAGEEAIILGGGLGILLLLIYAMSRKHVVTISSDGGAKIHFHTKGMKRSKILEFVNEVENSVRERREEMK